MANPADRRRHRNPQPPIPGRGYDWQLGGEQPDIEYLYRLIGQLETDKAEIGAIDLPVGGATEDDVLIFIGGVWTVIDKTDLLAFDDLTDVDVSLAIDGDLPVYSSGTATWSAANWKAGSFGIGAAPTLGTLDVQGRIYAPVAPTVSANNGLLNIGSGGYTGGAGHFAGSANGNGYTANFASGFEGDTIHLQINGLEMLKQYSPGAGIDPSAHGVVRMTYRNPSTGLAVPAAFQMRHRLASGTSAAGHGIGLEFFGQDSTGAGSAGLDILIGNLNAVLTNVTPGSHAGYVAIFGTSGGAPVERTRFHGDGRAGVSKGGANPLATGICWNITGAVQSNPSIKTYLQVLPAADTALTASTEAAEVCFDLTATRQWSTGALALQRQIAVLPGTLAFVGASTVTNADAVGIAGPPTGGTNATLTNSAGLRIATRAVANTTNAYGLHVTAPSGAATLNLAAHFDGDINLATGTDFLLATSGAGTKLGTGATQLLGFWGATPVAQSTGWSVSNVTPDKSFDANSTTIDELADVLGTLITWLLSNGLLGA